MSAPLSYLAPEREDVEGMNIPEAKTKELAPEFIIKTCFACYGLKDDHLKTKSRKRELVQARQLSMFLIGILVHGLTTSRIADFFGRDHSTYIHSCKRINEYLAQFSGFRTFFNELLFRLSNDRDCSDLKIPIEMIQSISFYSSDLKACSSVTKERSLKNRAVIEEKDEVEPMPKLYTHSLKLHPERFRGITNDYAIRFQLNGKKYEYLGPFGR